MAPGSVTVADDVLTAQGEEHFEDAPVIAWEASPVFVVVTDDIDGAMAALVSAPWRIGMTANDGREVTDESELGSADAPRMCLSRKGRTVACACMPTPR